MIEINPVFYRINVVNVTGDFNHNECPLKFETLDKKALTHRINLNLDWVIGF